MKKNRILSFLFLVAALCTGTMFGMHEDFVPEEIIYVDDTPFKLTRECVHPFTSITTKIRTPEDDAIVAESTYKAIARSRTSQLTNLHVKKTWRRKHLGKCLFYENVKYARNGKKNKLVLKAIPFDLEDDQPLENGNDFMTHMKSLVGFYEHLGCIVVDRIDPFCTPMEYRL